MKQPAQRLPIRLCGTLLLGLLASACSNNPLMQTPPAHSTNAVDAMNQELNDAARHPLSDAATGTGHATKIPPAVSQALLPPMTLSKPHLDAGNERFNLSVHNLPARDFFMGLVKGTPYNMVVNPQVTGEISLELKNVTIDQVMKIVRNNYGYDYKFSNGFYQVLPGGLRTEIYPINYLNIHRKGDSEIQVSSGQVSAAGQSQSGSTNTTDNTSNSGQSGVNRVIGTRIVTDTDADFWKELQSTLQVIVGSEQGRSIVATPEAGIIIVRAMPDEQHAVEDYLKRAQLIMQRQVVLEAKILEVQLSKGFEQGIDWSYSADYTNGVDASGNPTKSLLSTLGAETLSNQGVGGVFGTTLRFNDFNAVLSLLGKQGNVQVLSSPRIATVNNQKAVIKVGSDEFFVTDVNVDTNNNTNTTNPTSNTSVTLTPFFSGIALDVTPQIGDTGEIILHVHPSVSQVKDQTKIVSLGDRDLVLPLALSSIRETDSVIAARDGQIVVIGGLIQNSSTDNNAEVPFFSHIPVIGEAFKQKRQSSQKSELVILLRPHIVGANTFPQDINASRARFQEYGRYLANPGTYRDTPDDYPQPPSYSTEDSTPADAQPGAVYSGQSAADSSNGIRQPVQ